MKKNELMFNEVINNLETFCITAMREYTTNTIEFYLVEKLYFNVMFYRRLKEALNKNDELQNIQM